MLTALLLACVRNIQPRPVGYKFHAVLVVDSAPLASLASPDTDRWLPTSPGLSINSKPLRPPTRARATGRWGRSTNQHGWGQARFDTPVRWLKRAALRSKRKSTLRYKMLLDCSASSLSKSPIHYAHTDGVSAIRCLDQSVDEPPDSPAPAPPSRCLRGSPRSLCCQNFRSPRSCQSWQSSQQPRTFEHRLLLFSPDGARPPHEDFMTSVCEQ